MPATEQKQTRMRARRHLECALIRTTAAHEMTCFKFWTELNYYEWHKLLAKRRYKEATDSVKHFSSVLLVDIVWCMRSTLSYNVVRRHSEELFGNRQCLHLCLYNTGISWAIIDVFSWDKTIQDVYLRRSQTLLSQEVTRLFLPSYAGINEVKSYSSGMDYYPSAFPQSIFIHASCLY